ncbi:MAG TPA: LON peptidase substrate-binding domain-containing protein [Polyangiaceae bacterium]
MTTDEQEKMKLDLTSALAELPLFPLSEVVLYPDAVLPLHVFEPRYRTMLADCLAGHRTLAIVHVTDPNALDAHGQPRIARIAGAGHIVGHERFADGRSNIVLKGIARVRIEELPFEGPYRRARATIVADDTAHTTDGDRTALVSTASLFAASVRKHDSSFAFEVPADATSSSLADLCAHHLLVDPGARQAILEEPDVGVRVRAVTSELLVQQRTLFGGKASVLN